ncbi:MULTISPECIES: glycogen debranching protein [Amycolatopsis]|uniref:Mannosylglycerate hydrolase MGH1-like glycoside hydrolase domain-containing protein n=1 Tax=Amycolatopsis tucumanensis TaxID=401106 RepID=A0ABP7IJ24_9PSEU|nr:MULTISPECIES: glycogen debranching protein [Amycolatopsis]MCF6424399.1 glycogen debranching protein [Amycolatopsis tucumanensis]
MTVDVTSPCEGAAGGRRPVRYARPTLAARAARVLRDNDTGAVITAAPRLYPHMWSWDAAFISIGLARLDLPRAVAELETLFKAQWRNGMVPHIVFTDDDAYFPGPDRWGTDTAVDGPRDVRTSGICQPPVHAIAVQRMLEIARTSSPEDRADAERFARSIWPRLYSWHRWLVEYRTPGSSGLIAIVHGWESGMDNSPRWDVPYAAVNPGDELPPYVRKDVRVIGDPSERPTDKEYDRYLWLIEEMRRAGYDQKEIVRRSSFLVGDVFITALFAVSCDVLIELGTEFGQAEDKLADLALWASRARDAVAASCHAVSGMARDRDLRANRWLDTQTIAGFAPLLCGGAPDEVQLRLLSLLDSDRWCGHPGLLAPVPPSVSPMRPGFNPRQYWRGPQWPVVNWLFGWAFERRGWHERARKLREAGLRLTDDGAFGEYYEPFTGEPLGSTDQSWTAAVVLDWLCADAD